MLIFMLFVCCMLMPEMKALLSCLQLHSEANVLECVSLILIKLPWDFFASWNYVPTHDLFPAVLLGFNTPIRMIYNNCNYNSITVLNHSTVSKA